MMQECVIHILQTLLRIFDPESLIGQGGLLIVFLLVYASTGLFFFFFIPTGAILFTTGIYTATGDLQYDIFTVCSLLVLASVLGNLTGYGSGGKRARYYTAVKSQGSSKKDILKQPKHFIISMAGLH
jgi:membrane-associated protein